MKNVKVNVLFFVVLAGSVQNAAYGMNRQRLSDAVSLVRRAPVLVCAVGAFALSVLNGSCKRGQAGAGAQGSVAVVSAPARLENAPAPADNSSTRSTRSSSTVSSSSKASEGASSSNSSTRTTRSSSTASSISSASAPARLENAPAPAAPALAGNAAGTGADAAPVQVVAASPLAPAPVDNAAGAIDLPQLASTSGALPSVAQSNNKLLVAAALAGVVYWKRAELQEMYARVSRYLVGKTDDDKEAEALTAKQ